MAQWDYSEIRQKVRNVSGRLSVDELTNDELLDYVNRYMQYEFPAEVKLDRNYTYYEFNTSANTATYTLSEDYTNFDPAGYIDNFRLNWYSDPDKFENENPYNFTRLTPFTGDGATAAYATTLTGIPIRPGTMIVEDATEVFTDNSAGVLTGSAGGTGTINYTTGALSVTFNANVANGQAVNVSYEAYTAGRPQAVLFFNNQFELYPIPDKVYRFKCKGWTTLTVTTTAGVQQQQFVNPTDRPLKDQWGPAIAYGAARRIHSDYGEMDAYAEVSALYKEQINYILKRTHNQLLTTRSQPMF